MGEVAPAPLLTVRGLSKYYGRRRKVIALHDVSVDLAKGKTMVLIGPSGAGKSTLLRCLAGIEDATSGEVLLDGRKLDHRTRQDHDIRADIGMVFQSFNLFPHMTLLRNVMLAPRLVRGKSKEASAAVAREILERVGLADRLDHYPGQLSGGQQQRAAIARALAVDPKILLFDEPTSALDPETVGEVLSVMEELAGSGTTMMVATHEMSFARECGDEIVMVENGEIVERSSDPDGFFDNPASDRTRAFLSRILERNRA